MSSMALCMCTKDQHQNSSFPIKLFEELRKDVGLALKDLESDTASQYIRRNAVRAVFGYYEAVLSALAHAARQSRANNDVCFSGKEKKVLDGEENELIQRFKKVFSSYAKFHNSSFRFATSEKGFKDLRAAKNIRNDLTHPINYQDIQITDINASTVLKSYLWVEDQLQILIESCITSLSAQFTKQELATINRIFAGNT